MSKIMTTIDWLKESGYLVLLDNAELNNYSINVAAKMLNDFHDYKMKEATSYWKERYESSIKL
jgi:hypothetical protein